eukprot:TRINITY_DN4632_c0_g1_i3.p1 TRINITY_DN4632_c0_g1~~TRINITY_DN4632_c0_g1_i3.p1  ORF type:complete len:828 (-),score=308.02 TRINITY_DN4632_c0_g1_i3:200-2683(-)
MSTTEESRLELRKNLRDEQQKREKAEGALSKLQAKHDKQKEKLQENREENDQLRGQVDTVKKQNEELDKEKSDIRKSLDETQTTRNRLEMENETLQREIRKLKKIAETAEAEKKELEKKLKDQKAQALEDLRDIELQNKQLQKLSRQHSYKVEELETDKQNLSAQIQLNRRLSFKFDKDMSDDLLRAEKLEMEKAALVFQLKEAQKKFDDVVTENGNLADKVKQLEGKLKLKTDQQAEKKKQVQEKVDEMQKRIDELEAEHRTTPRTVRKEKSGFFKELMVEAPGTLERQNSIASSITEFVKNSEQFDEDLLKEPGTEKARLWEYHSDSRKWDDGKWSNSPIVIQMEKRPFAEGNLRTAYMVKRMDMPNLKFVAKMSKKTSHRREIYENDVEMQIFCKQWAEKFNAENPPKKVSYADAWLIELVDRRGNPVAMLETFIEGEYVKYSNNDGVVLVNRNTPQAFSHYTYEKSLEDLVIVDIQGVDDFYTDPQIHTKDQKGFGLGNLGQKGIFKFLITHECNAICQHLKLKLRKESSKQVVFTNGTMVFPEVVKTLDTNGVKLFDGASPPSRDLTSLTCIETLKCSSLDVLEISSEFLVTNSGSDLKIWDLGTWECKETLKGHCDVIEALAIHSKYIFSGSADKDIRVWSKTTFKCIATLAEHTAGVKVLICDGSRLYSGSNDKTIRVWSIDELREIEILKGHDKYVKTLAISQDSKILFSGGNDCVIKVWNLETMECIYNLESHKKWIKTLALSGNYLFSAGNDKKIKVWDISQLKLLKTVKPHADNVNGLLVCQDFILSVSDDASIKMHSCQNMEPLHSLNEHRVFSS